MTFIVFFLANAATGNRVTGFIRPFRELRAFGGCQLSADMTRGVSSVIIDVATEFRYETIEPRRTQA
ncbi:MAG: hypothetical protein QGH33_15900 [Pirellulaceae bacterium]|jgi:hypothetical protein|nr:hypothetical protein [Pirellulaceae bacterium]